MGKIPCSSIGKRYKTKFCKPENTELQDVKTNMIEFQCFNGFQLCLPFVRVWRGADRGDSEGIHPGEAGRTSKYNYHGS